MNIDFEVMVDNEVMGPADLARFFKRSASTINTFIRRRKQEHCSDDVILQKMFNEYGDKENYEIEQPIEIIDEPFSKMNKRFTIVVAGKPLSQKEAAEWLGTTRRNFQYLVEEDRREKIDDHTILQRILSKFNKPAWSAKLSTDEDDSAIPLEICGYETADLIEFVSEAVEYIHFTDAKSDIYKSYLLLTQDREPLVKRSEDLLGYWKERKMPSHLAYRSIDYICDLLREIIAYFDMSKSLHAVYGVKQDALLWFDDFFDAIENENV